MKKLPHELELKELLEALKGQDLDNIAVVLNDPILSFVQAFHLTAGEDQVSSDILYKLFRLWYIDTVFGKNNFSSQLAKYIPSTVQGTKFFKINKDILCIGKSIQDLLVEKKVDKTKSKKWSAHYLSFLDENNLGPGKLFVEADILYYVYNRWRDEKRKKTVLSYENFIAVSHLHFTTKKISRSKNRWFGVNSNIRNLINREEVQRWRESRYKGVKHKIHRKDEKSILYHGTKRKKENKKKSE